MENTDSFDSRDPFRPPSLLAALAALLLLFATHVRADEAAQMDSATETASATASNDAPAPPESLAQKAKDKVHAVLNEDPADNHQGSGLHWGSIYPSFAVVSTGASVGPMLQFWQPDLAGSGLDVHAAASYSILKYQYYSFKIGRLPRRRSGPPQFPTSSEKMYPLADVEKLSGVENHFDLYAAFRYRDYPREDFFGIGADTSLDDRTDYRLKDHLAEVVSTYHFSPRVALTARAGLLGTSLAAGMDNVQPDLTTRFSDATAPGLADPPDEFILTGGLLVDLRDHPQNPHRGALLLVGVSRFDDRNSDLFAFNRVSGDFRVFVPLGSDRHVIAARALGSFDSADAGNRVPFYLQSSLGGSQILRGYPGFRFRDLAVSEASAEYRFEAFWKIELAAFVDAGQVAPRAGDLHFSDFKTAYGVGIRLKSPSRVLARLDVAHGKEGTHFVVKLGPSF